MQYLAMVKNMKHNDIQYSSHENEMIVVTNDSRNIMFTLLEYLTHDRVYKHTMAHCTHAYIRIHTHTHTNIPDSIHCTT